MGHQLLSLAGHIAGVLGLHALSASGIRVVLHCQAVRKKSALVLPRLPEPIMREIVHLQTGQCGNQIGSKVRGWAGTITMEWE